MRAGCEIMGRAVAAKQRLGRVAPHVLLVILSLLPAGGASPPGDDPVTIVAASRLREIMRLSVLARVPDQLQSSRPVMLQNLETVASCLRHSCSHRERVGTFF